MNKILTFQTKEQHETNKAIDGAKALAYIVSEYGKELKEQRVPWFTRIKLLAKFQEHMMKGE